MNIVKRTQLFEEWMRSIITVDERALAKKHQDMAADLFKFFRATNYDWLALFLEFCQEESKAHQVLSPNDVHPANGGTWRDLEGRLIWGINDFDEAYFMPYTNDLIRLSTGFHLLSGLGSMKLSQPQICKALLDGYESGLISGGRPFVLAEQHGSLREMAMLQLRDPKVFWKKLESLGQENVPNDAKAILLSSLPPGTAVRKIVSRWNAGEGSLGRQRFVLIGEMDGGRIAREIKTVLPSSSAFAMGKLDERQSYTQELLDRAIRCNDPTVFVKDGWSVRRLSPDCSHVSVIELSQMEDEARLVKAFGFELANVHLGTPNAASAILNDLNSRSKEWLCHAAVKMHKLTEKRWKEWRQYSNL